MSRRSGIKFGVVALVSELLVLVLLAVLGDYGPDASPTAQELGSDSRLNRVYPMFQDVHVMIFIGFGFLMTFLRRYGYSAVSVNMLLAALVVQFALICNNIFNVQGGKILLDINSMLGADFTSAAILISFGVLLGRISPLQLLILAMIETLLFALNEHIGRHYMHAVDMGDSIFVHTFGAYFGLAASRVLYRKELKEATKAGSSYHSDVFSMIGTIFLWVFWPSFNAAAAAGDERSRALLHTYLSIAACCVVTCAISAMLDKRGRLHMDHIQNATLAGGVAVGASADFVMGPYSAALIGSLTAVLSVVGFIYITPFLSKKLKVFDTCGVNNLHGMPGILAALVSIILAALAKPEQYGDSLYEVFPAMAPKPPSLDGNLTTTAASDSTYGEGFSAGRMALAQLAALGITLCIAIVGGLLTGLLLRIPFLDEPRSAEALYEDEVHFEVPEAQDLHLLKSSKWGNQEMEQQTFLSNGSNE